MAICVPTPRRPHREAGRPHLSVLVELYKDRAESSGGYSLRRESPKLQSEHWFSAAIPEIVRHGSVTLGRAVGAIVPKKAHPPARRCANRADWPRDEA
jgi:hypothetical protein